MKQSRVRRGEGWQPSQLDGWRKELCFYTAASIKSTAPGSAGKKQLKMDLLLLSSPPWHLVKTPLPPTRCWNVPLWAGAPLTLLRVKVSRTRKKAGTMCWRKLRHHSVDFFFLKVSIRRRFFLLISSLNLFSSSSFVFFVVFCKRLGLKHSSAASLREYFHRLLDFSKFYKEGRFESAADNM